MVIPVQLLAEKMARKEVNPLPKPRSLVQLLFQIEYLLFHRSLKLPPPEALRLATATLAMLETHVAPSSRIESATAGIRRRVLDLALRVTLLAMALAEGVADAVRGEGLREELARRYLTKWIKSTNEQSTHSALLVKLIYVLRTKVIASAAADSPEEGKAMLAAVLPLLGPVLKESLDYVSKTVLKELSEANAEAATLWAKLCAATDTETFDSALLACLGKAPVVEDLALILHSNSERVRKSEVQCFEDFDKYVARLIKDITATYGKVVSTSDERVTRVKERAAKALGEIDIPWSEHALTRAILTDTRRRLAKGWLRFLEAHHEWRLAYLGFSPFSAVTSSSSSSASALVQTRHWKLSMVENRYRMRLVMKRNDSFDDHKAALFHSRPVTTSLH